MDIVRNNLMQIHHIGYLVESIQNAIKEFEKLGYRIEKNTIFDAARNISVCFMIQDNFRIEMVEAESEDSVVFRMAKKYRNMPYHICYESFSFAQDILRLTEEGYVMMQPVEPACALENRSVAFLMNADIGMIEVVENA